MPQPSLTDHFAQYRPATAKEIERSITEGMIVLDSNVLLNLYAYTTDGVEDWFKILRAMKGRIWMPHQVGVEFWSHRAKNASDPSDAKGYKGRIEDAADTVSQQALEWLRRFGPGERSPSGQRMTHALDTMDEAVGEVLAMIRRALEAHEDAYSVDPESDAIVARLNELIPTAQIGNLPDADARRAFKEAFGPGSPGSADDADNDFSTIPKASDSKYGDYFIWQEMLAEMESRLDAGRKITALVFVTADSKTDWWQSVINPNDSPAKQTFRETDRIMPRLSLLQEVHDRSVGRVTYTQLRPWEFLRAARAALDVQVSDQTVETAQTARTVEEEILSWDDLIGESLDLWRSRRRLASGVLQPGGKILVRAGALAELNESQSFQGTTYAAIRASLRRSGQLVLHPSDESKLQLIEDHEFSSLSAASTVLFGAPNVAKRVWRDSRGIPVVDLLGEAPVQARWADYDSSIDEVE